MVNQHDNKGFTLSDLIATTIIATAIIVIVLSLYPHGPSKEYAYKTICMGNQRQIAIAWHMYIADNDSTIISADTLANTNNSNWVTGPLDKNGQSVAWQNCAQEDEIRGIKQSPLYKYADTDEVFNCPAAYTKKKHDAPLGYRSYSMPSTLNGTDLPEELDKYRYTMIDQIKEADKKFMVVEEADTRGFNHNGWFQNPETPDTITDSIGIFHNKSSNFAFCDGHVENIKWENKNTIKHFENYIETNTDGNFNFSDPDNEDIKLIHKYYPVKK